jgi:hypothetical protein
MYKKEYPPLFESGFREIQLWQLDALFLEGFSDNRHRKYRFYLRNRAAELRRYASACIKSKDALLVFGISNYLNLDFFRPIH